MRLHSIVENVVSFSVDCLTFFLLFIYTAPKLKVGQGVTLGGYREVLQFILLEEAGEWRSGRVSR
jgi:hypothetical protein